VYATFLGGAYQDHGLHIAVDDAGQAVVTGYTESSDFPTTPGAFDTSYNGSDRDRDAFVVKLNPAGSGLSYGTFLGGDRWDIAYSVAVDGASSAHVTGSTSSNNFPTTPGVFQTSCYGAPWSDAFVVKLNPSGSGLDYATCLGGARGDGGSDISLDGGGNAYVTGGTGSNNFPTTPGAFDTSLGGYTDAFVVKLNSVGSGLDYATLLGGGDEDHGSGIAVDGAGGAYVMGATDSVDFPVTAGAFDTSHNGVSDVFVIKLNPAGAGLAYATFLGGSNVDFGTSLALDGTGSVSLTGSTSSADFPAPSTAFDPIYNGGSRDAFVARLNPTGAGLVYGTFLGGTDWDEGHGVAVDGNEEACVTGYTYSGSFYSGSFPTTPGSFDPTHNGNADAFVVKMNLSQAATPTATPTTTAIATPTPTPTSTPAPSQLWYVKPGGNDANDCRSPQTACATLQGPLFKAGFMPGDTIRAAVGVYTGAEGAFVAVLVSKDATFSGGWDAATFTFRQGKSEVNGLGQIGLGFQIAEGVEAAIEYFEIRECNTAGIHLRETGSVSISNCTLTSNGAGIDAYGQVRVRVIDSVINGNSGLGIFVGHYFSDPGANLQVENSTIASNSTGGINSSGTTTITHSLITQNGGGSWAQPGVLASGNSVITHNRIISNTNEGAGGGLAVSGSPMFGATIFVAGNQIWGNVARDGAGMTLGLDSGPATTTIVQNNLVAGNATSGGCGGGVLIDGRGAIVRNNIIANNTAEYGSGICAEGGNPGQSWIVNNTIVDNEGDGIVITNPFDTVMRLVNNIIAGNSNRGIVGWSSDPDAQTVEYNLVWGNSNGDYVDIPNMTGFNGNISQPPLLVNRFGGPWYLGAGSPAIDAGTNQHAPPFDIEGDPRPYNTQVDMGADEWTGDRTYPTRYLPIIMRR
jgi:hypothetical protein